MRDDHKQALKKVKQQISAFCLRHGYHYDGTKWTFAHLKWLKKLKLSALYQETLDEYMATYDEQSAKVERFDARIKEIASQAIYADKVKKLGCFLGTKTHTALSLTVETGEFNRGDILCGQGKRKKEEQGNKTVRVNCGLSIYTRRSVIHENRQQDSRRTISLLVTNLRITE